MNRTSGVLRMADGHLTEEEIFQLLIQPSEAGEAKRHLEGCELCTSELAAARRPLEDFRVAATGLAEARFSPSLMVRPKSSGVVGRGALAWPMGLAAAGILLAASVTMVHRPEAKPVSSISVKATTPESDEALLESINQDLSTSVPPSLEPLAVASSEGVQTVSKN